MIATRPLGVALFVCLITALSAPLPCAAQESNDELIQLIVDLLDEKDEELRAVALEQVRTQAKGEAATKRFAAELPKLPADAQAGLLRALAERGDSAAKPAVIALLNASKAEQARAAAIGALGALGDASDVPRLAKWLAGESKPEKSAARASLIRLRGDASAQAIVAEMKKSRTPARGELIEVLATRHALNTVPDLLGEAVDDDPAVREAAMKALGQIAGPEHVAGMVKGVLKAEKGQERDAAERAVVAVASRIAKIEAREQPLMRAIEELTDAERLLLLPTLGRIGGSQARSTIEAAIAHAEAKSHEAGVRALCNWPDASVAPRLIELTEKDEHADHRRMTLAALIRVAPLPDQRPAAERLSLSKRVMSMCTRDEDRRLVLKRAPAIRTVETLRFVIAYLDQPELAQQACEAVVELAHHRGLREPNKAEFHQALDKVLETSKDAVVIDRANRYKRDQTWVRPKTPDQR